MGRRDSRRWAHHCDARSTRGNGASHKPTRQAHRNNQASMMSLNLNDAGKLRRLYKAERSAAAHLLLWTMPTMTDQPIADVLAIAAHRDDVEQTCGGTLL